MTATALTPRCFLATVVVAFAITVTAGCASLPWASVGGAGGGSAPESSEGSDDGGDADPIDGEPDALTGADCLPGDWIVDNASFAALIAGAAGGVVDNISGEVTLTFTADGKTQTKYADWTHTITVDSATATLVKNGTDFGTYSVNSDGSIALIDVEITSDTTSVVNVGGQKVTHTVTPEPSVFSQASFECEANELSVTADGGTTILQRKS